MIPQQFIFPPNLFLVIFNELLQAAKTSRGDEFLYKNKTKPRKKKKRKKKAQKLQVNSFQLLTE